MSDRIDHGKCIPPVDRSINRRPASTFCEFCAFCGHSPELEVGLLINFKNATITW